MNQSFQRQVQLNPNVSPPPPDLINTMTTMMTGVLWVAAIIGAAVCAVAVIGALQRWTWIFWAILVLMGLGALGLPVNLASALSGSTSAFTSGMPSWISWLSVAVGIPGAAIFVWMIIALTRYGPWAMTRKTESSGVAAAPAT
jgi:hypothetical protein